MDKIKLSDEELQKKLTPEQFEIVRHKGTERAFTGKYYHLQDSGVYHCVACGLELFSSDTKFESGSGWPSFFAPLADDRVETEEDRAYGMVRTEIHCARCGAHLGHVFRDGPRPTGLRYCVNSLSLDFEKK